MKTGTSAFSVLAVLQIFNFPNYFLYRLADWVIDWLIDWSVCLSVWCQSIYCIKQFTYMQHTLRLSICCRFGCCTEGKRNKGVKGWTESHQERKRGAKERKSKTSKYVTNLKCGSMFVYFALTDGSTGRGIKRVRTVRTPPLFENMGLVLRPNLHWNS